MDRLSQSFTKLFNTFVSKSLAREYFSGLESQSLQ
jgi:hypothetical protein